MKVRTTLTIRSLFLFGMVALLAIAVQVRGNAPGITFAFNGIHLQVDSASWYNGAPVSSATWALKDLVPGSDKFFNFGDIKPGDSGKTVISLHVANSDAWMCIDFKNFQNLGGDLAPGMQFFAWHDNGDDVFNVGEQPLFGTSTKSASVVLASTTYPIADATTGPCYANQTCYVGIVWCAGDLQVNLATATITCDGAALGNAAQSDSMSVDVSLRAASPSDQPSFTCNEAPPPGNSGGVPVSQIGDPISKSIKCGVLAKMGWPIPNFSSECAGVSAPSTPTVPTTTSVVPSGSQNMLNRLQR